MSEWRQVALRDIATDIKDGTHGTHARVETGVPFLSAKNVSASGKVVWDDEDEAISETEYQFITSSFSPKSGDLLVTVVGTLGRTAISDGAKVAFQRSVAFVRPNKEVLPEYLFHASAALEFRRQLERRSNATAQAGLYLGELAKIRIPLPPPSHQRRIAEILSTLDEAIAQTEALIAKHQQIKAGLMHDLFTRGVTPGGHLRPTREQAPDLYKESPLGWIPKEWEVVALKSEIGITHGFAFSGEFFSDTPPGEVLLTPGNFHRDGGLYFTVENTKYFQGPIPPATVLQNGEMVTVMTDLSPQTLILGRFALVETTFPVLLNQRVGRVMLKRKDRWDWTYLCYALNDERVRRKIIVEATGTTVRHTSPGRILSNQIARPHLEEQRQSIEVLRSIERQLVEEQATLLKSKQEKCGLMHDLLTGKARVKPDSKTLEPADG